MIKTNEYLPLTNNFIGYGILFDFENDIDLNKLRNIFDDGGNVEYRAYQFMDFYKMNDHYQGVFPVESVAQFKEYLKNTQSLAGLIQNFCTNTIIDFEDEDGPMPPESKIDICFLNLKNNDKNLISHILFGYSIEKINMNNFVALNIKANIFSWLVDFGMFSLMHPDGRNKYLSTRDYNLISFYNFSEERK